MSTTQSNVVPNPPTVSYNYPSVFSFFSMISPFVVVLLFVLNSIINSNFKGFVYLLGVFLLLFVVLVFQQSLYGSMQMNPDPTCQLFNSPLPFKTVPALNSSIFMYTIIYILIPMISNNVLNLPMIVILFCLFAMDVSVRVQNRCTTPIGIVMGSVVGLLWGFLWYFTIYSTTPSLLYYDDLISNKIACSRPTEQKFKCAVYNNGQLLKSL
jgi:membrane-associated phospholipid phosphatase